MSVVRIIWIVAVATFVFGDSLTTWYGIERVGLIEYNPAAKSILGQGYLYMVAVKLGITIGAYVAYKIVWKSVRIGIPLGLAALGVAVTAWNIGLIVVG